MEHKTETHVSVAPRNRRTPGCAPRAEFYVTCSCGADSRTDGRIVPGTFSTSGMAAGWIAEHDPRLREMVGLLQLAVLVDLEGVPA